MGVPSPQLPRARTQGGAAACTSCNAICTAEITVQNRAPTVSGPALWDTPEGALDTGYGVSASDLEGDDITFSVAGGDDAPYFSIDSQDGRLRFTTAPDYDLPADLDGDNRYEVTLAASDGFSSSSLAVEVQVFSMSIPATATVVDRNLAIYSLARELTYRCDIEGTDPTVGDYDLGSVYFEYGDGAQYVRDNNLTFYPLAGGTGAPNSQCQDLGNSGQTPDPSQRCVFYDHQFGPWSLSFGPAASLTAMPATITTRITQGDCTAYPLQLGVTEAMCLASYTCTAQKSAPSAATSALRDAIFARYQDALHVSYDCHVLDGSSDLGHVFMRYGYGATSTDDYLYFYPAQDSCSTPAPAPEPTTGILGCLFFAPSGRWSLMIGNPTSLTELPASLTQAIATDYDCDHNALLPGITPEICKAPYTCTLVPDP